MNVSAVSLRDLEYIVAVAEQRHFGRAAEHCHVSQPALSTQIRKVEDLLEMTLFERDARNVRVTPAGEWVVRQAKVVLDEAAKIAAYAARTRQPLSGPLRLGAIASLGPFLLPHFLGPLRKKYGALELQLREGLTDGLIAELRAGALDVVLASPTFDSQGLAEYPLFFEPFVLAAPRTHELATRKPLRTQDLHPDEMVLLEDGHCLKDQVLDLCPANRRGNIQRYHATSLETLRHMIASGIGYSLLPRLARTHDSRLERLLVYRDFENPKVGRTISLYCREHYPMKADVELLGKLIRENLPSAVTAL